MKYYTCVYLIYSFLYENISETQIHMVLNIAVVHVQRYKRNPKEPNFFNQDLRIPFESCLVLQQNINILYM